MRRRLATKPTAAAMSSSSKVAVRVPCIRTRIARVSETAERVTYATLAGGQSEEFQRRWDVALERLRPALGGRHGHLVDGHEHCVDEGEREMLEDRSPIDRRALLGRFPVGTPEDVDRAVRAARRGFPAWSGRHWSERAAILRRAA